MTNEIEVNAKTGCIVAILALALVVPSIIFDGYVLTMLWSWFIATTFLAPQISIATAIGVTLIVRALTTNLKKDNDDPKDYEDHPIRALVKTVLQAFLVPSILLLMGWIVQGYQ